MARLRLQVVLIASLMISLCTAASESTTIFFMDRNADCGSYRNIGRDEVVIIESTSQVPPVSPITECIIYLQSAYDDTSYRFEISVERLQINDNTIFLTLYDRDKDNGATLRRFGTSSKSTDVFHGASNYLTIKLTRASQVNRPDYDFMLRIKLVGDPDSGGTVTNSENLSTGALIGIIVGAIVIILIPIVLCCMYGQGQLPGQKGRPKMLNAPNKTQSKDSLNSLSTKDREITENAEMQFSATTYKFRKVADEPGDDFTGQVDGSTGHSTPPIQSSASGEGGLDNPAVYYNDVKERGGPPGYSNQPRGYMPRRQNASYSNSLSELNGIEKGNRQVGRSANRHNGSTTLTRKASADFIPLEVSLLSREPPRSGNTAERADIDSFAERKRAAGSLDDLGRGRPRGHAYTPGAGGSETAINTRGSSPSRRDKSRNQSPANRDQSPGKRDQSPGRRDYSPGSRKRIESAPANPKASVPKEGELKGSGSGIFENPDEEGYIYSYDHLSPQHDKASTKGGRDSNNSTLEKQPRHKYNKKSSDHTGELIDDANKDIPEIQDKKKAAKDMANHTADAKDKKKRSDGTKTREPVELEELKPGFSESPHAARYKSIDQQSEPGDMQTMSNPLRAHGAIKSRLASQPELDDQPETSPSKRTKSVDSDGAESASSKVRYAIPPSAYENQGNRSRMDSYPYQVGPSAAYNTILGRTAANGAPDPDEQRFLNAIQSSHNSPAHHSTPDSRAVAPTHAAPGGAQWFVQTTPSREGPVTQGAFVVHSTHPVHRDDSFNATQTPNMDARNKYRTHRDSPASTPYSSGRFESFQAPPSYANESPGAHHKNPGRKPTSALRAFQGDQPAHSAQTPHKAGFVRSGIDPKTGNEVNQVVWTDSVPHPTDPAGTNPSVSRSTITRITTQAGHGEMQSPTPILNQLVASRPALGYDPRSRPDYSQEYPYNDNEAFYLGAGNHSEHNDVRQHDPPPSTAVVHQGPAKSSAIRDKIRLDSDV